LDNFWIEIKTQENQWVRLITINPQNYKIFSGVSIAEAVEIRFLNAKDIYSLTTEPIGAGNATKVVIFCQLPRRQIRVAIPNKFRITLRDTTHRTAVIESTIDPTFGKLEETQMEVLRTGINLSDFKTERLKPDSSN
jgi:hypothetical protein